jgi:hypothetical protein
MADKINRSDEAHDLTLSADDNILKRDATHVYLIIRYSVLGL